MFVLVGSLVGMGIAEATRFFRKPSSETPRFAELERRDRSRYLSTTSRWAEPAVTVVASDGSRSAWTARTLTVGTSKRFVDNVRDGATGAAGLLAFVAWLQVSRIPFRSGRNRTGRRRFGRSVGMMITVDPTSAVPTFEQIRVQIERMVGAGVLKPGARLPTIAQLSNDLLIAPGTVARAYRELEAGGIVASRRRTGTMVADHTPRRTKRANAAEVDLAVSDFVRRLRQLGVSVDDVIDQVNLSFTASANDGFS